MDWIPGLSQAKSLFQVVCGDLEGARQTQENFLKQCPVVSQGTSLVQVTILDDEEGARKTQKAFLKTMSGVADGIPAVGHVKGVIHYACGDKEGGDQAMKSSSRTVGVIGGGVGGFFVGGPVGAVVGGMAGGAAMDGITTGVDSAVHGEYRPAGHIATVTDIVKTDENPSGKVFDLVAGVAFDGLTGRAAGQAAGQISRNIKASKIRSNAASAFEAVENNPSSTSGDLASAGKTVMSEMKRADAIQGIKTDFTKFGETVQTKPPIVAEPTFIPVNESEHQNSSNNSSSQAHQTEIQRNLSNSAYLTLLDVQEDGIQQVCIISTNIMFNDALIALLDDDLMKCAQVLKKFEIERPFSQTLSLQQVAALIIESGCAVGYDQKQVENVLKKSGKRARETILTLFGELMRLLTQDPNNNQNDDGRRHRRGEHVINNGVLRLHKEVIDLFLTRRVFTNFEAVIARVGVPSQFNSDYKEPFSVNVRNNIQNNMVAHIPADVYYFDANALMYGIAIQIMRESSVRHMSEMYDNWPTRGNGTHYTTTIRTMTSFINTNQVFVDQMAKAYWLTHHGGDLATFERTREIVESMFENLYRKLHEWVLTLKVNEF